MESLPAGTIHDVIPDDLYTALIADNEVLVLWSSLTALARNEWICWTISPKRQKTRNDHVTRVIKELKAGARRPCCWIGCIHRTDKEISLSVQGILKKEGKK